VNKKTTKNRRKVFDIIWAFNYDKNRFEYDCKLYMKDNCLYCLNSDKFCRELTQREIEYVNKLKKTLRT